MKNIFATPTDPTELRSLRKKNFFFGLFMLAIACIGIGAVVYGNIRIAQAKNWPSVLGKITKSQAEIQTRKTGRAIRSEEMASIQYSFNVDGQPYEGACRRVVPFFHFGQETKDVLDQYSEGASVTVYYNSNDPSDALLQNVPSQQAEGVIQAVLYSSLFLGMIGLVLSVSAGLALNGITLESEKQSHSFRKSRPTEQPKAKRKVGARQYPLWIRVILIMAGGFLALLGGLLLLTQCTGEAANDYSFLVNALTILVMAGIGFGGAYMAYLGFSRNGKIQSSAV